MIFRPNDTGYDDERAGFQTGLQHASQVIFAVETPDDVREAVKYAESHGLEHAVQATGHGIKTPTTGVLISTRRMNRVRVDPVTRTARVEAGAVWQQVIEAAAPHGLAPLSGSAGHVGVVGYTLGGGYGLLAREFGLAKDQVRKTETVGDVVTAMEFGLVPVTSVHGGGMFFDAEHAAEVFEAFHEWDVPDHVTPSLGTIGYPDLPMFPEQLRGRHVVHLRFASTKPFDVDQFRTAPRLIDDISEMPFTATGSIYRDPPVPHTYQGDNVLLNGLPRERLHEIRELTGPNAEVPMILDVRVLGGAINTDATHIVRVISPMLGVERHHAEVFDAVRRFVVGRVPTFAYAVG